MAACREFSAFPKKGKAGKISVIMKSTAWRLNTNTADLSLNTPCYKNEFLSRYLYYISEKRNSVFNNLEILKIFSKFDRQARQKPLVDVAVGGC